jgi:uncharacterized protein DUF4279
MNPFTYSVSFRIWHPHMNPLEISAKLSLTPETSWTAGELRSSPKGKVLEGKRRETYWSHILAHRPDTELADCLETFTQSLEPHAEYLKQIRENGGRIEYFIGWFSGANSGEIFTHQLLGKLARLQIDLAFDIYGAGQENGSDRAYESEPLRGSAN